MKIPCTRHGGAFRAPRARLSVIVAFAIGARRPDNRVSFPLLHALCARSFGIRIRLKAAQLNTNNQSTFASPRSFTFFNGPICFSHPNGFSTNQRLLKLIA